MSKQIRTKLGEPPNNNIVFTKQARAELTARLRERGIIGISYFRKARRILPQVAQ